MFVAPPSAALLHLYSQMSCHNQVKWGTAAPWSTLRSLCPSFGSVPNRARPWKRTSSADGWNSGEFKSHHVSSPALPQIPLTGPCPVAIYLIWPCLSTCWMKQLGQKKQSTGQERKSFGTGAPIYEDHPNFTLPLFSPPPPPPLTGLYGGLRD